jgi:thiol-disulfide isomerase/thioredoxin
MSPNSKIVVSIDENNPFESSNYSGSFTLSNNFLAYSKKHQNQLSEIVRKGIQQEKLEILLQEKGKLVHEKGVSLNIVDSLQTYVKEKFNQFSEILKKKNTKYLYKASLINSLGNDFSFKDINNKNISLKDFKGKYVYIDIWATWCKPCKVEHVFLKELEEHFAKNKALQIISISIDREYDTWKKYVSSKSMEGVQLHSGSKSDFVKFYDIGALPRFIFLDKEGKVISPDEIRPSNPKTLTKLEDTLSEKNAL